MRWSQSVRVDELLHFARVRRGEVVVEALRVLRTLILTGITVALCGMAAHAAAPPVDLSGRWQLDEEASDDSRERLQGLTILRTQARSVVEAQRQRREAHMTRQQQVTDEMQLAKERKLIQQEADVGALGEIIHTLHVEVTSEANQITLAYDGGLTRTLAPRPGGARYSAKGDEFVETGIGRSMVFWRGRELVVETLLAPRGTMIETLRVDKSGQQLEIRTILRNPDWLVNPEILRVFNRQ